MAKRRRSVKATKKKAPIKEKEKKSQKEEVSSNSEGKNNHLQFPPNENYLFY